MTERPTRVLIIDDDRKLCALIHDYLGPLGFEVTAAHTGPSGVERATAGNPDVVILDVMLPGLDGFEVLKRIRQKSQVPVLMLTARGEETDRIVGLEVGADDYLPKTFSARELLARLRSVTRRAYRPPAIQALTDEDIVIGKLRIIPSAHSAFLGGSSLVLTPVEYDLLLCLA